MITLHHLNHSRSWRIVWLLEALGEPYQIKAYARRADNALAPEALKAIHPLGKAPILDIDGHIIAESGAMVEYLIERYGAGQLAPARDSAEFADYLQWIHFAESSAMLPFLLKLFIDRDGCQTHFMDDYATAESGKILSYWEQSLTGKTYLVGERLSGADMMNSFMLESLAARGVLEAFPNLAAYYARLSALPSWQRAKQAMAQAEAEMA